MEHFLNFFTAIKSFFVPRRSFYRPKDLATLSYTSNTEIPTLSYKPETRKGHSFWCEPPGIGH